ncbi:putative germin-like protein subfamily 1 member 9 [Quercus suber]|uniref:Germin-like protein subfamily 1 member 9 n=1 Tax=Quercus suber TaxID=58331 RepID=A0AAW0KPU7_QUESU
MTKLFTCLLTVALLALASSLASAHDPSSLQDFCVAVNNSNSAGMYLLYYGFLGVVPSHLDLVFSCLHSINRHVLICNIIHTSTKHSAKTTKHTASNMTKLFTCLLTVALLALASSLASAHDPSSLQDFCVAVNNSNSAVFVNGKFCKDPKLTIADDFSYLGLTFLEALQIKLGQM